MTDQPVLEGGCLCGAVRYRLRASVSDCGYCHCRLCQRASGAPVLAFATVPLDRFELTGGQPRLYRSSPYGERWFCRDCGTQLAMRVDDEPDTIDVTVAALDQPLAAPPGFHIWESARIGWFDTRDTLPRYLRNRPEAPVT